MNSAERRLKFHRFGAGDPLDEPQGTPAAYIRRYLDELGCKIIIEEPVYFDRDYLAEFEAFYCKSARGYANTCRRLHFFADAQLDRPMLERALGGHAQSAEALRSTYLGFAVLRPFEPPLFGRTVLRWYPDEAQTPGRRVTSPSRNYVVHLAGLELEVCGLAWQEQDSAVGACATISLWSTLHSSAFDDHHAIPTTAAITRAGHRTASLGRRVFPSFGLTTEQMLEAIKAQSLSPIVVEGDLELDETPYRSPGFSLERFSTNIAAFIRSGYPVVLWGMLMAQESPRAESGMHAVCVTGFREPPPQELVPGVSAYGSDIQIVYVHNDNLGPAVRCRLHAEPGTDQVFLRPEAPTLARSPSAYEDVTASYEDFQPMSMVVAVHNELNLTPDTLHSTGLRLAEYFRYALEQHPDIEAHSLCLRVRTRYSRIQAYLGRELSDEFEDPSILAKVRLALTEGEHPLSLYLGVVQISTPVGPALTVLYDTTDNERFLRPLAHISTRLVFTQHIREVEDWLGHSLGPGIYTHGDDA